MVWKWMHYSNVTIIQTMSSFKQFLTISYHYYYKFIAEEGGSTEYVKPFIYDSYSTPTPQNKVEIFK